MNVRNETMSGSTAVSGVTMFVKLNVAFSIIAVSLVLAPQAVAIPADQCTRWCSGSADYQACMENCLHG